MNKCNREGHTTGYEDECPECLQEQIKELKTLLYDWARWDGFCTACGDSSQSRHKDTCPLMKHLRGGKA